MPRNVLIVTESFPPNGDIAARRYAGLAPHLESFGWRPWILTTHGRGSLPARIPDAQILRVGEYPHPLPPAASGTATAAPARTANTLKRFAKAVLKTAIDSTGSRLTVLIPGNHAWYRESKRRQDELLDRLPEMDAVVGCFRPAAGPMIAARFADAFGCPWIAELRDLGALLPGRRNPLAEYVNRAIERRMYRTASGFVTVSPTLARILQREYGRPSAVVYNGWDAELDSPGAIANSVTPFAGVDRAPAPGSYFYYAGLFYPHRMSSVLAVLDAMTSLPDLHFAVRSLGPESLEEQLRAETQQRGLTQRVHILPPCPPAQVNAEAASAFANLVLEELEVGDESGRGTLTGKFLKLLPLRPAVLAVARPDSDIGPILDRSGKGRLCSSAGDIRSFAIAVRAGSVGAGDPAAIEEFSMPTQAGVLAGILDATIAQSAARTVSVGTRAARNSTALGDAA